MSTLPLMNRGLAEAIAWRHGQPVCAGRFIAQAERLAATLDETRPVINLCQDRYAFSVGFAAALLAGSTTLLPANRLPATVEALLNDHPDARLLGECTPVGLNLPCLDPTPWLERDECATCMPLIDADLLAALVFTSGSTGPCSRIAKPWYTLYFSSLINALEYGPNAALTHGLATVPPQHMWGLETSVLLPWFSPLAMADGQPFYAADIGEQLARLPQPRALISTPVHLRVLAESSRALPHLERVYSATAPLSVALARSLEERTGARVIEVYGCSEAGCLARREPARDERWQRFAAFSLDCDQGRYRIDASHLPSPVHLLDNLQVDDDGRFRLDGRHSDLINIAGKRASLCELTQRLLEVDGVVDGVIFQPPDLTDGPVSRLAALVVAPGLTARDIRRALARQIDPAFMPRPLRLVESLPRSESGKLPKKSLVHFYRQVCESVA